MGIKVTNEQIWLGAPMANVMAQVKFPIRTGLALGRLTNRLAELRKPIEAERIKLVEKWAVKWAEGDKDAEGKEIGLALVGKSKKKADGSFDLGPNNDSFQKEFRELMDLACEETVIDAKIKLPEKVAATCDKCHHNMERLLEIEPAILAALDSFVEVA